MSPYSTLLHCCALQAYAQAATSCIKFQANHVFRAAPMLRAASKSLAKLVVLAAHGPSIVG